MSKQGGVDMQGNRSWIERIANATLYVRNPFRGKQKAMLEDVPENVLLQDDCFMVNNLFQCPGIARVQGVNLVLTPVFGKSVVVPIDSIRSLKVSKWFNGSLKPMGKTGITLKVPGKWRISFAVTDPDPWLSYLRPSAGPT
jgi:hypothetical protein